MFKKIHKGISDIQEKLTQEHTGTRRYITNTTNEQTSTIQKFVENQFDDIKDTTYKEVHEQLDIINTHISNVADTFKADRFTKSDAKQLVNDIRALLHPTAPKADKPLNIKDLFEYQFISGNPEALIKILINEDGQRYYKTNTNRPAIICADKKSQIDISHISIGTRQYGLRSLSVRNELIQIPLKKAIEHILNDAIVIRRK